MQMTAKTSGEGEPLVLIHGVPGSARIWDGVAERLAPNFRTVLPDLLGFGESPGGPDIDGLWADSQARALAALLDDLGVERAALVGHDFGGPVALALAELRPELVSHLVLCATNAFPDTPIPLPISAVTWPIVGGPAARLLFSGPSLGMTLKQGSAAPGVELDASAWLGDGRQQATIRTIFSTALREIEARFAPVERQLRTVECPVLAVWGEEDPFFSVDQGRRTADAAREGRFVAYDGCGHFVPAEQPERLAADIAAFVREPVAA